MPRNPGSPVGHPAGVPLSPQHRAAIADAMRGRKHTAEHEAHRQASIARTRARKAAAAREAERAEAERAEAVRLAGDPGCGTCVLMGGPHDEMHLYGPRASEAVTRDMVTHGERVSTMLTEIRSAARKW